MTRIGSIKEAINEAADAIKSETDITDGEMEFTVLNTVDAYFDTFASEQWELLPLSQKKAIIKEVLR